LFFDFVAEEGGYAFAALFSQLFVTIQFSLGIRVELLLSLFGSFLGC
jgi:hypothetical protein